MHKLKAFYAGLTLAVAVLSACSTPGSAEKPTPTTPQRIDFQSTDGTLLVGTYWPPSQVPAPGILLMHMMGARKESWQQLPDTLQKPGTDQGGYAVFAFDFRGHGESQGNKDDRAGMLEDAKAALSTFHTLPGVDRERIVLIGAGIGADAAVIACREIPVQLYPGCVGAILLVPGSYLDVGYYGTLSTLGDKPVLCVASDGDLQMERRCRKGEEWGLTNYQFHIYKGEYYGIEMLNITDQEPSLTELIVEWLNQQVP